MSPSARATLFALSGAVFLAVLATGLHGLSPVGRYPGPYGDVVNGAAVPERHATDVVAAVTFDYRGFDTLNEEFLLFVSVVGVALLLRRLAGEHEGGERDEARERHSPPTSDAVRGWATILAGVSVTYGLYVVTHGHLTPGGGFQGGVILATAPLVVYLAEGPRAFQRIAPQTLVEVGESLGAGGFVLVGALGVLAGKAFLENVLPLGELGSVLSSGTILALNVATGLAVAAGFVVLLTSFVEETMRRKSGE